MNISRAPCLWESAILLDVLVLVVLTRSSIKRSMSAIGRASRVIFVIIVVVGSCFVLISWMSLSIMLRSIVRSLPAAAIIIIESVVQLFVSMQQLVDKGFHGGGLKCKQLE